MVFEVDPGPNPRELECLEIMRKEGASKGDEEEEILEKVASQKPREECVEEAGVHVRDCWDIDLKWRQNQLGNSAVSLETSFGRQAGVSWGDSRRQRDGLRRWIHFLGNTMFPATQDFTYIKEGRKTGQINVITQLLPESMYVLTKYVVFTHEWGFCWTLNISFTENFPPDYNWFHVV